LEAVIFQVKYEEASQVANDAVGSFRTVASFCAEEKVMSLYSEKSTAPLKSGIHQGIITGIGFGFSNFLLHSAYAISFWVGARMVEDGETTSRKVFRVRADYLVGSIAVA
jgi:ATP-binding cassette subfamily B (MDR/TAP) protein 1